VSSLRTLKPENLTNVKNFKNLKTQKIVKKT